MPSFSLKIPADFAQSMRLDQYVASVQEDMNRSHLKAAAQEILLNGKDAKLSATVKGGDIIDILWEDEIPENIEPENIPLAIVYEDERVTVVNKEHGMVTHPAAGNWNGTLVNALLYRWGREAVPQMREGRRDEMLQKRRPGIVHRLDKDTSGLIITARTHETEEWLCTQFRDRRIQKEYLCIVRGRPPASAGDIRTQIVRDMKNRKRFKAATSSEDGKAARSLYHCIACYGKYSVIRVRIKTGRTHQIRVHMRYLGCPILGDKLYGKADELFPDLPLMLHARKMIIKLAPEEKYRRFLAPIPPRFYAVLKKLKETHPRETMPRVHPKCKK